MGGMVGLFRCIGPDKDTPHTREVAVKVGHKLEGYSDSVLGFGNEAKYHWLLNQSKSLHISQLFRAPVEVTDDGDEESKYVARLLLEYCPLETLAGLIQMRSRQYVDTNQELLEE